MITVDLKLNIPLGDRVDWNKIYTVMPKKFVRDGNSSMDSISATVDLHDVMSILIATQENVIENVIISNLNDFVFDNIDFLAKEFLSEYSIDTIHDIGIMENVYILSFRTTNGKQKYKEIDKRKFLKYYYESIGYNSFIE